MISERVIGGPRPHTVRALATALGLSTQDTDELMRTAVGPSAPEPAEGGPVRVEVLGPLAIRRGSAPVAMGDGLHRVVLGRLALTPNVAVSRDGLVDLLWGEAPPPSSANLVQTYVSRLRRVLEPQRSPRVRAGMVTLVAGGYRLGAGSDQLDLVMYRDLVARATAAEEPDTVLALLDQALGLWRDTALADVPHLRGDPLVTALTEDRIATTIRLAKLAQALSRQEIALPRLRELARQHPLHEPLQACLIKALAACGQRAAALDIHRDIRCRLADELGVDLGSELAEAHLAVLRQDPGGAARAAAPTVRPHQVPAPPPDFTGRLEYLRQLENLMARDPRRPAPRPVTVCVISGAAGVGKTSLALRAAQVLRPGFPDGLLYIDLLGAGRQRPVGGVDALARFLRALGVDGRGIPQEEGERAALYRSLLADRRVLIMLDNTRDAAQVRALIPGTGGNAVLVTSRNRLADLAGATTLELGVPSPAEALDMLAASAGPPRVAGEPETAAQLAAACGRLPLALRVAGSRLASRPHWTVRMALDRLADQRYRLDRLRTGDVSVEASFEWSYQELGPRAARAFRMAALAPGPAFTAPMAAALLGANIPTAEEDLHELVDSNLVQQAAGGRFRYHDLLRLYAIGKAEREETASARSVALRRLLDWYLAHTAAAIQLVYPEMIRLPVNPNAHASFTDPDDALAWLDAELSGLAAAIEAAAGGEHRVYAWQLADQLRGYFFLRRHAVPWLATGQRALAAAESEGDIRAQAAMHQTIGQAHWSAGHHEQALAEYRRAAALADDGRWPVGLAYQLHNIGLVQAELGRFDEAQANYRRALDMCRDSDFDHVRAATLNDLGSLCHERGLYREAERHISAALDMSLRAGGSSR